MSFFNSVLRAFGFGHDEEDYDDAPSALVTPYKRVQDAGGDVVVETKKNVNEELPVVTSGTGDFPMVFFDAILEVFNNAQP